MRLHLKKFKDVSIGDTLSVLVNNIVVPQRVISKVHEESLYKNHKENYFTHQHKYFEVVPESDIKIFNVNTKGISGLLERVEFQKKDRYLGNAITFSKEYIKWISDDSYLHTNHIKEGDVIWHMYDAEHYYLHKFNKESAMEYGGQTFDASYFSAYRVDRGGSKIDKEIRRSTWGVAVNDWLKTSNKKYSVSVSDFAMISQNYYPIIKKD